MLHALGPPCLSTFLAFVAMSYIDALVPGIMGLIMGLLLVTVPRVFTRAEGDEFKKIRRRLKSIVFVLFGVLISGEAILYLIWQM